MAERWSWFWPGGDPAGTWRLRGGDDDGYVYMGNDHRGRRAFLYSYAPDGSWRARLFFYDLHDNLIGVREQTSAGQNRFEMYAHIDGEPVFRWVLDNPSGSWIETERTFFYNDHLGTPRAAVAVDGNFATATLTYQAPREAFMASAQVQDPSLSRCERLEMISLFRGASAHQWSTAAARRAPAVVPTPSGHCGGRQKTRALFAKSR
jgi:hypothetical protein